MPETLPQPATLLIRLHGQGSRHIELTHETLTIGRTADNTLAIEDPASSGHHARIVKVQAAFFLENLMSTNGTGVVEQQDLNDGGQIEVAGVNLMFSVLSGT